MKTISFKTLIASVIVIIAISLSACHNNRQRQLEEFAKNWDNDCPLLVAGAIRLDSVSVLPNLMIKMHTTWLEEEYDRVMIRKSAQSTMKNGLIRNFYNNEKLMKLINEGAIVCISILDSYQVYIADIYITSADLKKDDITNRTEEEYYIENLRQQVEILQSTLPQKIGGGLVVSDVNFNELTKTVEYTYTFDEGYDIADFAASYDEFKNRIEQFLKTDIRENEFTVEFIRKGFIWKYVFLAADGTELFTIVVDDVEDLYW